MDRTFVIKIFKTLKRKYQRSLFIFIFLSITSFILSAVLVILNLFAIRYNPGLHDHSLSLKTEQWLFICIVIISTISSLISSILSLFTFKKRAKIKKSKIEKIKIELQKYHDETGDYVEGDKDRNLVNIVASIINE